MFNFKPTLILASCLVSVIWTGCRSSDMSNVSMPPRPPAERMHSTIFPEKTPKVDENASTATEDTLPEGVTLRLKGKDVDYAILATVPDPENRTVKVLAKPSTLYGEISGVLERLHEMGFLISFEAQE